MEGEKNLGLLAYVDHDNQREKPVYFKWQILDWDAKQAKKEFCKRLKYKT